MWSPTSRVAARKCALDSVFYIFATAPFAFNLRTSTWARPSRTRRTGRRSRPKWPFIRLGISPVTGGGGLGRITIGTLLAWKRSLQGCNCAKALECPHWFVRPTGSALLCANCGEFRSESLSSGHRSPCAIPYQDSLYPPCRCLTDPCCCKSCLVDLLGQAQRAQRWDTIGPLFEQIPALIFDDEAPLSNEKAKRLRNHLSTLLIVQQNGR